MDQAGLMDKVDQMMIATASALPLQPPAASSSPTCRETQLKVPTSSASTGGRSDQVLISFEVHQSVLHPFRAENDMGHRRFTSYERISCKTRHVLSRKYH